MTVEQIIADYQAKGILRPEMADWLRNIYTYEMTKHGDDAQARRVLSVLLNRTAEEHRQKVTEARAVVEGAIARKILVRPAVPTSVRVLQAVAGSVAGAIAAVSAIFVFFYVVVFLIELIFGSTSGRIRIPAKGILAVLIAPIAGAVIGAMFGWRFDVRDAVDGIRRFLDAASILDRAWLAWGAMWSAFTVIAFALFDPFGRYSFHSWLPRHLMWFAVIWIGPIAGGWLVTRLVRWVANGRRD